MQLKEAIELFLNQRRNVLNIKETTLKGDLWELNSFLHFLKGHLSDPCPTVDSISYELIEEHLHSRSPHLSRKSLYTATSILRKFCNFLMAHSLLPENAIAELQGPKMPRMYYLPEPLSMKAIDQMCWFIWRCPSGEFLRWRDMAMLLSLYTFGLRRSELTRLRVCDVNFCENYLLISDSKTGHQRKLPLVKVLIPFLHKYLSVRRAQEGVENLFVSQYGTPISGRAIRRRLRAHALKMGVKDFNPHRLRHSCATHLLNEGNFSLPQIGSWIGHRDENSTLMYVRVSAPYLHRAVAKHPINELEV